MIKALRISILFCALALIAGGRLPGQTTSARIFGSVQNEEGKFLAGVEVTAINVANNAETKVYSSGPKGTFNFLSLAAGSYQVSFDLKGYHSYVAAGIRLSADQSTTLRITMKRLPGVEGAALGEEAEPDSLVDLGPFKTWQVELSVGAFDKKPDELNRFIYSDLKECRDLPTNYYWEYRTQGLFWSGFNGRLTGMLKPLGGLQPLTARLRYALNRSFSLAAGVNWSERRLSTTYSLSHDFFNYNTAGNRLPERFVVSSEFPDYRLGVNALFPHVGGQASAAMSRALRLAGFAHAGWMFAECSFYSLKTVHDGLLGRDITQEQAMEGRGSGPAIEGGFKVEVDIWRGLGFFFEGAYLLSRVNRVTGASVGSVTVRDQKTLETLSSVTEKREGQWWTGTEFFSRPTIWPDGAPATESPFGLDLGGPGLRAGFFFRF